MGAIEIECEIAPSIIVEYDEYDEYDASAEMHSEDNAAVVTLADFDFDFDFDSKCAQVGELGELGVPGDLGVLGDLGDLGAFKLAQGGVAVFRFAAGAFEGAQVARTTSEGLLVVGVIAALYMLGAGMADVALLVGVVFA